MSISIKSCMISRKRNLPEMILSGTWIRLGSGKEEQRKDGRGAKRLSGKDFASS
jgi:hypothetical protein